MISIKLFTLLIFSLNFYNVLLDKNINLNFYSKEANDYCKPPVDNFFIHSCENFTASTKTSCLCTLGNNEQKINLVCKNTKWVRNDEEYPCLETNEPEKVTRVVLKTTEGKPEAKCDRPFEDVFYFHSCTNKLYPSDKTSCECTTNSKTVELSCKRNSNSDEYVWYYTNSSTTCEPTLIETQVLDEHWNNEEIHKNCEEPEENLHLFHTCRKSQVSKKIIGYACTCSADYTKQISLVCHNNKWYQKGHCKAIYHPSKVLCYNDKNKKIICNCRKNCMTLNNDEKKLKLQNVINKCDEDTKKFKIKNNMSITFNEESNTLEYKCMKGYFLYGSNILSCNNGKLNESLPRCILRRTDTEDSEVTTAHAVQTSTKRRSRRKTTTTPGTTTSTATTITSETTTTPGTTTLPTTSETTTTTTTTTLLPTTRTRKTIWISTTDSTSSKTSPHDSDITTKSADLDLDNKNNNKSVTSDAKNNIIEFLKSIKFYIIIAVPILLTVAILLVCICIKKKKIDKPDDKVTTNTETENNQVKDYDYSTENVGANFFPKFYDSNAEVDRAVDLKSFKQQTDDHDSNSSFDNDFVNVDFEQEYANYSKNVIDPVYDNFNTNDSNAEYTNDNAEYTNFSATNDNAEYTNFTVTNDNAEYSNYNGAEYMNY